MFDWKQFYSKVVVDKTRNDPDFAPSALTWNDLTTLAWQKGPDEKWRKVVVAEFQDEVPSLAENFIRTMEDSNWGRAMNILYGED